MPASIHKRWIGLRSVPLFIVVWLAVGATGASAQGGAPESHWEGALTFRGAEMPVRVHLRSEEDSLLATLDVPSLVMAWEPVPATRTEKGVRLELPFGLGELPVEVGEELARGAKEIGEDTLVLDLRRAPPPPFIREDVRFMSGDTELAGTLVLPQGAGPHPGAVLLHRSGRQGRLSWEYRSWADLLVRRGLAVLYYDMRGVGESEGEYGASLSQLANDAAAAVQYLRSRSEVDPGRIGLKGASQGAWIAEQVAAELGDISFLLLVSAAAGTPRDQELQKVEYGMRADGRTEAEIEDALAYLGLYFYVARTGEGWALLQAAVRQAQAEEWGQYVDQPRSEADLAWWRENHAFQPGEFVTGLDLPVLLLYGGSDWITPYIENAGKLRSLFLSPERVEVHVFPGADHRLEIGPGRDAQGNWHWPRNAPDMHEVVARWLDGQG